MAIWQGSGAQLGGETPVYVVSHTGSPAGKKKKNVLGKLKKKKKKKKERKKKYWSRCCCEGIYFV